MEKRIQDYLQLYLGCEAMYGGYGDPERKIMILGVSLKDGVQFQFSDNGVIDTDPYPGWMSKLILRPLSSMTKEEEVEIVKLAYDCENGRPNLKLAIASAGYPEVFRYLLSKHFDLFNLIPDGLAIDKTKQP